MIKFGLFGLIFGLAQISYAQNISNEGKDFWVGYGHHQFMEPGQSNSQEMVIYLSAGALPATVVVSINATSWTRTYNIPANTVIATEYMPKNGVDDCRLYSVPPSFGGTGGEGVFQRGINIKSNVPIVAYAHTFGSASSGATMLIPITSWGNVYYTLNSRQTYANNCFSWAYVVAQEDNTVVEITPSVQTRTLKPAGVPFTVNLNKGQLYQIIGNNPSGGSTALEISGSKFKSIANASGVCPPIAVFSGSSRTSNPVGCGSGGGDNDNQQCFPTNTWGKIYLTAPTSSSTNPSTFMTNSYKVLVKDPTTIVKRNGVTLTGLTNNYYFFESNTADLVEADKPIMVAEFMSGGACLNGGLGDPEMMYISPLEQGIKKVGFYRNNRESIQFNYLTLIIPTNGIPSLRIDGSAAFDHSYAHPRKPGFSVVVKRWNAAQAQATVVSDSAFTAITYGLGSVESYGYNAGTFLNNLNLVGSIRNPSDTSAVKQHDYTCKNSPVTLSALYLYQPQKLVWELSTLGANITPNTDVTDNSPVANDSVYINGIKYYKYSLPGTYQFNDTGTFVIPINSTHPSIENCLFSEKLTYTITVKPTPKPTFTYTHSGCTTDTVFFFGNANTLNGYQNQQYLWTFPGPTTAITQNTSKLFPPGLQTVNFRVVTNVGCVGDTTANINIQNRPTSDFTFSPAQVCENGQVTFTDNSGVSGTGPGYNWYWDFGNGNIVNATTNTNQTQTYPAFGTYIVKHVVRSSATCFSDTVVKTINVYAKPRVNFTFPTNCVGTNGQVLFTNTTTIPDGQTLGPWAWTFNDPNANGGNPNTSALLNPTHNFSDGTYNVNLQATSQQGCIKDTTIAVLVKVTPALSFPSLAGICINTAAISIANATVTNGVTGSGVYSGPGTSATGTFTPTAAGVGTHTIWYKFTSTNGCVDSISQTILVKAKPIVNFTYPTGGCLPPTGLAQFNGTAGLSDGQTVSTWAWNFNDPNATGGNPNTSALQNPTHNFTANGIYNVQLTVNSSGSCAGDTTIALNFNIKPSLAYPAINSVCINVGGTINVATATVTNGVTGTGVYNGPSTTSAGIFTPTTAGVGNHTIWYKFTTPNGCVDSISQTILVKAKPIVNFTYPTGGCLPPNGLAQFNGTANLSDGQTVSTWAWDFNDPNATGGNPNTSALQNPTHNFTANGIYNVKLTVNSSGSCAGDTIIALNFNIKPSLAYPAINSVCINVGGTVNVATASVTNGATGTGVYNGPGTTAAGIFTPTAAGVGNHTIWYKFTTPNGCVDSVSQTILVKAKPIVNYTYPTGGCLPPTGLAQFNGTANFSDGQTVSTWAWDFNDPNANGANPNTSGLQNPTHNFTANGIYNVKLTVNSSGSCAGDTTIALNFNIKPTLAYPALLPVCQSVTGTVNVATASVTNGATGTGVYSGPSTTSAGQFSPAGAGAGVHTIWYKFTTPNGCVDSVSQTITVQPKPNASFTKTDICAGLNSTLTSTATIAAGTITNWYWDFGDATTANYNNGSPFTKTYATAGTYIVKFVATSSAGCISDTAFQTITVYPNPVAAFSLPTAVCMPGNAVNMTNQSTIAGNGNLNYSWTFGDGNTSVVTNPAHIYTAIGNYTITLTASSAFGCVHTVNKPFNAFFVKPIALFSVNKDTLCQGQNSIFTDLSTDPVGSTITNWNWSFGDGTTASVKNPTKTFGNPNTYTVNLTVTNAAGCISTVFSKPVVVNLQPVIDAGPSFTVQQGTIVTFNATANSTNGINLIWSPGIGLSSANVLQPKHTATADRTYTLTATGPGGCTASDFLTVKVLKPVKIPNAFSPNGDGTNDRWDIENLIDYTDCNIQIYNRYGQKVQQLTGYDKPWDGTINGKPLPVATYYYIIDLKNGLELLKGAVTIIR